MGLGVAGAVAGGVMQGFEALGQLPEMIEGLMANADPADKGPLASLKQTFEDVSAEGQRLLGGFLASAGPGIDQLGTVLIQAFQAAEPVIRGVGAALSRAFEFFAPLLSMGIEAVSMLVDKLGSWLSPVIDKVSRGFDVVGFVFEAVMSEGVTLFGELLDGIGSVIESVTAWVGEFFSVSTAFGTVEEIGFKCFRVLGQGAAYVWDTLKAGAGAMSYVASFIVDGFSMVVEAFKDTIKDLLGLAGQLPDALGGAGFRKLAEGVDGWGDSISDSAARMRQWGAGAIAGWGNSVATVDQWFDRLEGRFQKRADRTMMSAVAERFEPKLAGALEKNSKEAYSVVTRFNTNALVNATDPARQQLGKLDDIRQVLDDIRRGLAGAPVIRTF